MSERDESTQSPDEPDSGTEATKLEGHASSRVRVKKPDAPHPQLARGTLVGRYVLLDKLGEGGMGVVYGAFDPELDRKVAIKVLQGKEAGGSSGGDQAWLLREAQALARLAHPNVVAVHDVGTLPGDQVFVAMELVDGVTMRQWLKEKARTWREVVPVMLAAGAGLAAAHEVGLVHRDFKPENVLVGKDGRVRVMDFGLARLRTGDDNAGWTPPPSPRSDAGLDSKSPLSAELTIAGHVVGTPAYMAPEIYEEHPADARTDQFAFGVTLYEGLFHTRPYDRKDLLPSRSAPPKAKRPADARVPAALEKLALRAIAIDPAHRFASMHELLAQLAIDPLAARRRVLVAGAAVLGIAALGGGVFALARHRSELCTGAEQRLAGVWDPAVKDAVHAAFVKTKRSYAERSFAGLARALDAHAGKWTAAVTESCQATRVRGEQTEEVLSLRGACLDQRLEELRALSKLLVDADKGLVDRGDSVVAELEKSGPIDACANVALLRAPGTPPPELRPQIQALMKRLAVAKADMIAGNYLPALTATKQVGDEAAPLHWDPLTADIASIRGAALLSVGNADESRQTFEEGTWAGIRGRRDDLAAHGAFMVAMMTSDSLGKPKDAQQWLTLGSSLAARVGHDDQLEAHRWEVTAMVAAESGDLNAAVPAAQEAYRAAVRASGNKDGPGIMAVESDLGSTLARAGAYELALPHYEHSIALRVQSVGEEHPEIPLMMSNLGLAYAHVGELDKAHATLARALALREKLFGKNSPLLVATLDNFGELLAKEGKLDDAIAMIERARKLAEILPGTTHPAYHTLLSDKAKILREAGKLAESHAAFDEAIALERKYQTNVLPQSLAERAQLAVVEHKWAEAETFGNESVAAYEAEGGKEQPELWRPLSILAAAKVGAGDPAAARALLERAVAIAEKAHVSKFDLAPTRAALAALPKP